MRWVGLLRRSSSDGASGFLFVVWRARSNFIGKRSRLGWNEMGDEALVVAKLDCFSSVEPSFQLVEALCDPQLAKAY
jgi:hypothetical protein